MVAASPPSERPAELALQCYGTREIANRKQHIVAACRSLPPHW